MQQQIQNINTMFIFLILQLLLLPLYLTYISRYFNFMPVLPCVMFSLRMATNRRNMQGSSYVKTNGHIFYILQVRFLVEHQSLASGSPQLNDS